MGSAPCYGAMGHGKFSKVVQGSILKASMDVEDCKALFAGARRRSYEDGQTVFSAGESGDTVFLIESGRIEVSVTSLAGRKSVLAHMGPAEVLGEIAALDGGVRSADAVAVGQVTGLVLSRQNILAFVAERPNISQAIIAELCRKVRNASDMFSIQSVPAGAPRLATALLRLFDKWGTKGPDNTIYLREQFSQAEIGEFCGLARENVNRHITAWGKRGVLRFANDQMVLLDRAALEELAGGVS